jgi:hypothetical protein
MIARFVRSAALVVAFCIALPASAESPVAAPASARLTVEQAREAQALFGFDAAIPTIIEQAFKEQPQYRTMTPAQRDCILGLATPAFYGLFDDAFIEMFGDSGALEGWRAFSLTPGGRIFLDGMRKSLQSKLSGGPEYDLGGTFQALSDAEKADVVGFMGSPASKVMQKGFPDVGFPPSLEKTLNARALQECGVSLDPL